MADYGYLRATDRPEDAAHGKPLLSCKYRIAPAWTLGFSADDVRADGLAACERTAAIKRLHAARKRLAKHPRLSHLLDGLIAYLDAQRAPWLVLDARGVYADNRELAAAIKASAKPDVDEPWELQDDGDLGEDSESVYVAFGSGVDEDLPWLRPPQSDDQQRRTAILGAFAGYKLENEAVRQGELALTLRHPAQPALTITALLGEDRTRIQAARHGKRKLLERKADHVVWTIWDAQPTRLAAWAKHLAEHGALLAIDADPDARWWTTAGGRAFREKIASLPTDIAALRDELPSALLAAIDKLAREPHRKNARFDLGELGHLAVAHVGGVDTEPHVHATVAPGPGDAWWPEHPEWFVSPADERATIAEFFAELARTGTVTDGTVTFGISRTGVTPERFTPGFVPPRARDRQEHAGVYTFVGDNLIVVTAEGVRCAFRFPVPKDLDKSVPPVVSGWWTAKGGGRFASILRIGERVWHFDNEGKLLAGEPVRR